MGGAGNWVAVSMREVHVCALGDDATIWCWGNNSYGQANPGTPGGISPLPTQIDVGQPWQAVTTGTNHSCGLTVGGDVWCWGGDFSGQAGAPLMASTPPTQVAGSYLAIGAGDQTSCGLDTTHHVQCWGIDRTSELGRGGVANPTQSPGLVATSATYASLAVGWNGACAVTASNTLDCWGDNIGIGVIGAPTPVDQPPQFASFSVGHTHQCGIDVIGNLYCNGDGSVGELANGMPLAIPTKVNDTKYVNVALGLESTCALATDNAIQCWGDNNAGQLATNGYERELLPVTIGGTTKWSAVRVGTSEACGIAEDMTGWCWGNNADGGLGTGTTAASTAPQQIASIGAWKDISIGDQHACGIDAANKGYCWGNNAEGQLGIGATMVPVLKPMLVDPTKVYTGFSTGMEFTCSISGAVVRCSGLNNSDQLAHTGGGSGADFGVPGVVAGSTGLFFAQVTSGSEFSCALTTTSKSVFCWGRAGEGELGNSLVAQSSPTVQQVATTSQFNYVVAGNQHACGLTTEGTVACWGNNDHGQLGDGTYTNRLTPTLAAGLTGIVALGAGGDATCAVDVNNVLSCWGDNSYGQLGTGAGWTTEFVMVQQQ